MPNFYYKATDAGGKWVSGEIREATRDQAAAQLIDRGLLVESLTEGELHLEDSKSALSRRELVELLEQLSSLARSGLPLPSGLRAAGQEVASPALRSTFSELADRIESGSSLPDALASSSRAFPGHLERLVLAGASMGRLADVLGEYVRGANVGAELRRKFWWTLAYPMFSLVVVVGLVGFICSLSVKAAETLIDGLPDFGQGRNRSSSVELLSAMARFVTDHGLEVLAGALVAAVVALATIRFAVGPAGRRRLACSIPVVGPILRFTSLAEFCHLLAMLIEAETPLPLAFEMAGSSVGDADVAEACARMGRAVEGGSTLSDAVATWGSIPAGLGQLFRWSEDRRGLPSALRLAGDMFEARARSQSSFAGSVLSTWLLLLILWAIGFAIATLYLPLISLINRLSG